MRDRQLDKKRKALTTVSPTEQEILYSIATIPDCILHLFTQLDLILVLLLLYRTQLSLNFQKQILSVSSLLLGFLQVLLQ